MKKRQGSALIMIVTLAGLLLLAAVAVSSNSVSDFFLTDKDKSRIQLEHACQSAINRGITKIDRSFNNNNLVNLEPEVTFQGTEVDDTTLTPADKAFNDEEFYAGESSEPDYYTYKLNEGTDSEIIVKYAITEAQEWDRTAEYTTYKMKIDAVAYSKKLGFIAMQDIVNAARTSLSRFGVFYQNDLEINPGPNFNLRGLIHTNENMYLTANNTLSINTDSITSAGEIYRKRLDTNATGGTVKISSDNEDGSLTTMNSGEDATNSNWTDIASNKWKGTVRDSNLGASTMEAPKLESFEPGGYYYKNAGLRIEVITSDPTITKYKITQNGISKTYRADDSYISDAISETQLYDKREFTDRKVKVTQINPQKLASKGLYPSAGLIYLTRDDAKADNDGNEYAADPTRVISGFKLVNGSTLPQASTFVTNLPMYVQGDLNKHTSTDTNLDAWKPCAIVADAINLLSNSWVDSKSYSKTTASSTTFNTIMITGNTKTKYGQYNGGLENFPRFLENWTGKNCNISGAFVQLFRSKYSTAKWGGTYYDAPTRNWETEQRFKNLDELPPGYADMFPSINYGLISHNWKQVSKEESSLTEDYE